MPCTSLKTCTKTCSSLLLLGLLAVPGRSQTLDTAAAASYSEKRNGHALLILQHGKVVFERYANGWTTSQAHRLASGTKSFTAVLLMCAAEDGMLSLDGKVASSLTEWQGDKRKAQITWRQLLGLVSGLDGGATGKIPSYTQAPATGAIADPGKRFSYGPNPFQCFGEALRRILANQAPKETVEQYLHRRLLRPLGMTVAWWRNASTGEPDLPSGAYVTAREWVKFAEMIRLGGRVGSKMLIQTKHLNPCFQPGPVSSNYGVGWWLPGTNSSLPVDLRSAMGAGSQHLYIIPSMGLSIVRLGESTGLGYDAKDFLASLLPAATTTFGSGCTGTHGIPRLLPDSHYPPISRKRLGLRLDRVVPLSTGLLWVGVTRQKWGPIPLPLDLGALGMKGCALATSADLAIPLVTTTTNLDFRLMIPRDTPLLGQSIYSQVLIADSKANTAGLILSNGVAATIGIDLPPK